MYLYIIGNKILQISSKVFKLFCYKRRIQKWQMSKILL
nr:MAG TPA: hypothetical protein [Caudoviricetes sp.]DAW78039.1 MAG TPA: hypothetical protein [Caudoviricetes sp.]